MLDQVFSDLAVGFAEQFGAPFATAEAVWPGTPVKDAGGSITGPASPIRLACKAQFDAATQAMRQAEGFQESDVRILVLAVTLDGALDTGAKIEVATGDYAGVWALLTCTRDPAGIGFECRARRVP